jgi:TetR/AcrR family transcriptional repressor of mexJK operon
MMACPHDANALTFAEPLQEGLLQEDLMAQRPLGRPKDLDKREAILDAAAQLFAQRGVDGVAVETIAAAAAVSKVTVYANFKDKSVILEALVQRETCRLGREVDVITASGGPLAERLAGVGMALVCVLTAPCHLALDRCLGLEAARNPELARGFFEAGPGHLRDILAQMLGDAMAAGEIRVSDPKVAAEDLLGLWLGFRAIERRFLCSAEVPKEALVANILRTVGLFLRANAV